MEDQIRILILEDDESLREMLAELIGEQGYYVEAVGSGEAAVSRAAESAFDLVVTDIRMEGMSGLEALEQMKEHQPDIGSLVVTGYSTEADSIRAIRLGVGEYLKKPFDLTDFLNAVEALLEKRRQAQAISAKERTSERVVGWAVWALAKAFDGEIKLEAREGEVLPLSRMAEVASNVAIELELSSEAVDQVRNACLVSALEQYAALRDLEFPYDALSAATRRMVTHSQERWDGAGQPDGLKGNEIPLGARIVAAALEVGQDAEPEPGRCDPEMLERAETARTLSDIAASGVDPGSEQEAARRRRGLLSLGRALEEAGHTAGATQAFTQVTETSSNSREGVEAHLGLARLAQRAGNPPEIISRSELATNAAGQVGPVSAAWTSLRAGLLSVPHDAAKGLNYIRQADRWMGELRIPSGKALACLALLAHGEGEEAKLEPSLQALLAPENVGDLAENGHWLIPYLLTMPDKANGLVERTLARLARECTRQFRLCLKPTLNAEAKVAGVKALATAGGQVAEETLANLTLDPDAEVRQAANDALEDRGGTGSSAPLLKMHSLGAFEVHLGEERLDGKWRGRQLSYLLAFLAAQGDKPVNEDLVIDAFWPKDANKGKKNLSSAISHLRRHLKTADSKSDYLVRTAAGLGINPELPRWHDLEELHRLIDLVRQHERAGDRQKAVDCGRQIARLYRGPYLEGCYMEWAVFQRDQVEQKVIEALRALAQGTLEMGRHQEAVEYGQQVLDLDPCCQEAHLVLMMAYIGLGRPEQAVRQYETCRTKLARELGMEPSIAILEAYTRAKLSIG